MNQSRKSHSRIVVAGHICLDVIPGFPAEKIGQNRIEPGKLYDMGPALFATGGAVSNTGLALHHLGVPTTLMGKIADDLFGGQVRRLLQQTAPHLADGMLVSRESVTSYSIVISPPGVDRSFLHCPGANDTFRADEIDVEQIRAGQIFHFGYPPLMKSIYEDEGKSLASLFKKLQSQGVITSLDMAMPDPQSPAGRVDWKTWLKNVLPFVDLFLPSYDEIQTMLGMPEKTINPDRLASMSELLLQTGAQIVAIKLGEQGLYLRTGSPKERFINRLCCPETDRQHQWPQRELLVPCFEVDVAGTTGAGDCTIAGFLAAFSEQICPEQCLLTAVAVGAFSVEQPDATQGIAPLKNVRQRIHDGWQQQPISTEFSTWKTTGTPSVLVGPHDSVGSSLL